jgi:hypothetical protein
LASLKESNSWATFFKIFLDTRRLCAKIGNIGPVFDGGVPQEEARG